MDLYSLPKDMLVKLVSTIGEEKNKEKERLEIILKLIEEISPMDVHECSFSECNAKCVNNGRKTVFHNCRFIYDCEECQNYFCGKHIDEDYILCVNCISLKND